MKNYEKYADDEEGMKARITAFKKSCLIRTILSDKDIDVRMEIGIEGLDTPKPLNRNMLYNVTHNFNRLTVNA